jgi:citrate synthase
MAHSPEDVLDARAAAEMLGVKVETLYAYVSRGLLSSREGGRGRARRYRRADVEALRQARGRRATAAGALRWGEPVLATAVSELTPEGPTYRSQLATRLAEEATPFESVAELLWSGTLPATRPRWPSLAPLPDLAALKRLVPPGAPATSWNPLLVGALAARDPGRFDARPEALLPRARQIVRALVVGLALPHDPSRAAAAAEAPTIAGAVALALGVRAGPAKRRAIDACLVLMAEHELNASTFAARVVASTRADVYGCVQAGLAALSGPLHGAASDQVEALLAEAESPERAEAAIHARAGRGERIPGFGHPYYKEGGDPRARVLVELATELGSGSRELRTMNALIGAMERAGRPPANVDAGAVALRAALGMPRGAVTGLFAVARSAGWVAHTLEQLQSGQLLRPRARYTGEQRPRPEPDQAQAR